MADKPSRALVLYGDGLARFVGTSHTHLHCLASKAACGFLSLHNAPPSVSEDERVVREFAQLLDACEACLNACQEQSSSVEFQEKSSIPMISERFMGMKAAIITDNSSLKSFCGKLGLVVLQFNEWIGSNSSWAGSSVDFLVSELLKLLGFQEGRTSDSSQFDLVFVHMGAGEEVNDEKQMCLADDMEHVNALVGGIMQIAQAGSEIGSRLHLSLVLSYGQVSETDVPDLSLSISKDDMDSNLAILFPQQSYTMKGENPRKDVRHHCPLLVAQWQDAVTRKDMVETFSFKDFKEHGCNLVIPADRFLHEVAFKLWKAPKYGA